MDNQRNHSITLTNRKDCVLTGVTKTVLTSPDKIIVTSVMGDVVVTGKQLRMTSYDEKTSDMSFSGEIDGIKYSASKTSLVKRLLK